MNLVSLNGTNTPGGISGFSTSAPDTWIIGTATSIGSGLTLASSDTTILATDNGINAPTVTPGDSGIFALNTAAFATANGISPSTGNFALELLGTSGSAGTLEVVYNGTPEPGTGLLALAGLTPFLAARRRRRNETRC